MFWGVRFLLFVAAVVVPVAPAVAKPDAKVEVKVTMDLESCAAALMARRIPRPLDYAASDLEGSFLELMREAAALETPGPRGRDADMERFLNQKAFMLNTLAESAMPLVLDQATTGRSRIGAAELVGMLITLGVSPEMYGLTLDTKTGRAGLHPQVLARLTAPPAEARTVKRARVPRPIAERAAIGFVPSGGEGEPELPPYLKRTVGFAPTKIERSEKPPERRGGALDFADGSREDALKVIDREKGGEVEASLARLHVFEYVGAAKTMRLKFSPEDGWFVAFESTVNPEGKIGF